MSDTTGSPAAGKVLGDARAVGDAARQLGQQAGQAGSDAISQARDVAHEASARAGSVAGVIGDKATAMAESGKGELANRLEDMAEAVHRSGAQLEGHQDWVAHLVERGAAELKSLATTLRSNDLQGVFGELGSLARRQPALFVGASMAAGFALTRIGRLAASMPADAASSSPTAPSATAASPAGGVPPNAPAAAPMATSGSAPGGDQ